MNTWPLGVPGSSVRIKFSYSGGETFYYVWAYHKKDSSQWYWYAEGQNGEAGSMDDACRMAREWLLNRS